MGRISKYTEIASPDVDDLLIGTDVENGNETRNFTIQSIADLVSVAAGTTPTLQQVSTAGNSTTVDLIVNGVRVGVGAGNVGKNTVLGYIALIANTTGENNTAIGLAALNANTIGICNTAIGAQTLEKNTEGYSNTAIGYTALNSNTTGVFNTAVGHFSLNKNTTGNKNTALGYYALKENISGNSNVGIGEWALDNNQYGSFNTAIGTDALYLLNGLSNSTGIGYNAQVEGSNQIQLGSGATTCYTNGAVQNRSDLRDKTEVRDTVLGLDFINELRPVDYKWDMREDYRAEKPTDLDINATEEEKIAHKIAMNEWLESVKLNNITQDGTHTRTRYHHGLIAQEVQDVIEATGVDFGGFQDHKVNGGGDVLSLGYTELIAPMIKAIQELKAEIELLKSK